MPVFRYSGIPSAIAMEARETLRSPQYRHPAYREVAGGYGPCRLCLRTFAVGREDRLLFTYQPFMEPGSLPAPGPVFVHAESCARYDALEFPPEEVIATVFAMPDIAFAHLRNGEAGCFMARVDRCFACD